jgi:hypothetical protein
MIGGVTFPITQAGATPTCTFAISPSSLLLAATGGSGSFNMDTSAGCSWTAVSNDAWLQVTGGSTGTDDGVVSFSAAPNTGPARNGTIVAGGQTFTAAQASGCVVAIAPESQNFEVGGGSGTITVTTEAGCNWSAAVSPGVDWLSITSGSSGTGAGAVQFNVLANAGAARSGTIVVDGRTFTVTQGGV